MVYDRAKPRLLHFHWVSGHTFWQNWCENSWASQGVGSDHLLLRTATEASSATGAGDWSNWALFLSKSRIASHLVRVIMSWQQKKGWATQKHPDIILKTECWSTLLSQALNWTVWSCKASVTDPGPSLLVSAGVKHVLDWRAFTSY